MAYGDFLYKRDNIIGYTGNLKKNPTVYFVREAQNAQGGVKVTRVGDRTQILFLNGHITQHHDVCMVRYHTLYLLYTSHFLQ